MHSQLNKYPNITFVVLGYFYYTVFMNAKWIERIIQYRETYYGTEIIKTILHEKVSRQMKLIQKYNKTFVSPIIVIPGKTISQTLLCEARYAKLYWKHYSTLLPVWCNWKTRKPHSDDIVNKLLDIGYHTLVTILQKKCEEFDIPTEIGLFHKAQSKKAHPLVYDIMECFRAVLVDSILLRFLHMKKEPIEKIDSEIISHFLHDIYEQLDYEYYHSQRKSCISMSYWIDLVLLELRGSVSEKRLFKPKFTPYRHENRCNKKSPHMENS